MPKIFFRHSTVYNQHFKEFVKLKYPQDEAFYPPDEKIMNYITEVNKKWNEIEQNILDEMARITNLNWSMKFITCYVVGNCVPFSDPLTMKVFENVDRFIDTLVHELIHQLFVQKDNRKKMEQIYRRIEDRFENETKKTKIHIPLHAVHTHLYKKLFNEERLKNDIERSDKFNDYKRAWEIVNSEGFENILKLFK